MALIMGSLSVPTTATPLPISSEAPGSITIFNDGPNAVTIGPSTVTAGQTGLGFGTIPPNQSVVLSRIGGLAPGTLWAVAATAASTVSWFYGTDLT